MPLLSLHAVADLAGVTRPAVTQWRRRYASSERPFPQPVEGLLFDADEVAAWLDATGRTVEARAEAVRFSTDVGVAASRLAHVAALLLVQSRVGGSLADVDADDAFGVFADPAVGEVVDPATLDEALADRPLVAVVDALVEAHYTASAALDTVLRAAPDQSSRRLDGAGEALLGPVVRELLTDRLVQPVGTAATALLLAAVRDHHETSARVALAAPDGEWQRAAQARLLLAGLDIVRRSEIHEGATVLVVRPELGPDDAAELFDEVRSAHEGLGEQGRVLVVGQCGVLVDPLPPAARAARQDLLVDARAGYLAPLRYVAALPRGLVVAGGRMRLALWLLDAPQAVVANVLYGEHAHHSGDAAQTAALARDVAAAADRASVRDHTYLRTRSRATGLALNGDRLAWQAPALSLSDGASSLRALQRAAAHTDVLDPAALDVAPPVDVAPLVPWEEALAAGWLRLLPGARIDLAWCTAGPVSSVSVIGAEQVRGTAGPVRIDRLDLAARAPSARFTEPGDVVYVATGRPAAVVDSLGGSVVRSPARIARCLPPPSPHHPSDRPGQANQRLAMLLPWVLAADIGAAPSSDTRGWLVHRMPATAVELATAVGERTAARRAELHRELAALDDVAHHLYPALAAGTLRPTHPAGTEPAPTKET